MIDTLELSIPFDASLVDTRDDGRYAFVGVDLKEMEIMLGAKTVYWNDEDELKTGCLYHPYESLPTNYTGMACKVHFDSKFFPHVTIKGSVAKIMQGHNVFGTDNLEYCTFEMLYWLRTAYPSLYGMLAVQCTEVTRIDITYMSKLESEKLVKQAISFLSQINNGHSKITKSKKYETTAYWGGATSRLIRLKCYGKYEEYQAQFDEYAKKASQGDSHAMKIIKVMADERIKALAENSLRWEATFLKRYLERNHIPTNVWSLIQFQKDNKDLFPNLWRKGFSKVIQALQGQEMKVVYDDEVLNKIKSCFRVVQRPKNKVSLIKLRYRIFRNSDFYNLNRFNLLIVDKKIRFSYRKANNLYDFYRSMKLDGYQTIKRNGRYSVSRFNELVADLVSVGFSKAFLQNLTGSTDTEIIPFLNLIDIDFSNQTPTWWVEPMPTPMRIATNDENLQVA